MVLIRVVQQDPGMGMKIVHPSIDDDNEAINSDIEIIIMRMLPRQHMMAKI